MRLFRLAIGIFIIVQGIMLKEWMFAGLGALFTLMPLMISGCNTSIPKSRKKIEDITFEEIK